MIKTFYLWFVNNFFSPAEQRIGGTWRCRPGEGRRLRGYPAQDIKVDS